MTPPPPRSTPPYTLFPFTTPFRSASAKLGTFFGGLLVEKRQNPGTDLISHLATVEVDGERLPDDVLISFLRQLMNAGGDTTYRGTSVLLTGLLTHPAQPAAVAADRNPIPRSTERRVGKEGVRTGRS